MNTRKIISPSSYFVMHAREEAHFCDICKVKLKKIAKDTWICPECQEIYKPIDSQDHIDPHLAREAGMR